MKLSKIFTLISAASLILLGLAFIAQSINISNAELNIKFSFFLFVITFIVAIVFSIIENKKDK